MNVLVSQRSSIPHVIVVGAGYAGALAALRLAGRGRGELRVTLVNDAPHFVERIRLHELAAGRAVPARPLGRLLRGSGVELVVGRVVDVQRAPRRVCVEPAGGEAPRELVYDALVLALGSGASSVGFDLEPGLEVHGLHGEAAARRLASALAGLSCAARVAFVGGGLTAIEGAAELAEARPDLRVSLHSAGEPGAFLSRPARAHVRAALERLGVELRVGSAIASASTSGLRDASGRNVPADLVVACTGLRAESPAARWGLATAPSGRMAVDPALRSPSDPRVFGAGDGVEIVAPGVRSPRMACASALPLGAHAADNALSALRGGPLHAFRFGFIGQCVSLGRRDGVVDLVRPDDTPLERAITGRLGARIKEAICRFTLLSLSAERLLPGAYTWRKTELAARASAPRIARA